MRRPPLGRPKDVRRNVKAILIARQNDEHLAAFYDVGTIVNEANAFGGEDGDSNAWGSDIHVWACTHLLERPIQIWRYSDGEAQGFIERSVKIPSATDNLLGSLRLLCMLTRAILMTSLFHKGCRRRPAWMDRLR